MSQDLIQKGALSLLQFSADEWDDLQNTRNGVSRFSLTFEHDSARSGKKNSLVLITVAGSQFPDPEFDIKDSRQLFIGVVNSIATVAMFSSRVVFTSVEKIAPGSLEALLDRVTDSNLRGAITSLRRWDDKYRAVSPKPASSLIQAIAAIPENRPALQRMLARMDVPRRFENGRALQQDAVRTALKVFGAGPEADAVTLGDDDTALGRVRLREDMVVAYDAMSAPGWTLSSRYQTGRATFTQDEEQLDIITVNKQPLEEIFGVDLIYLNQTHRALVMLQYKMMEPAKRGSFARFGIDDAESDEREWLVWIDSQFKSRA